MHGVKYCALGNDYLVIDSQISNVLDPQTVRRICDRHWGLGADGILRGHLINAETFGLTIFNSDGSVAEISGNGTSIFGQYLWDYNKTLGQKQFSLETSKGKSIACEIKEKGIRVQLARALFCNKYIYEVPQHLIEKYGVSYQQIYSWVRKYEETGIDGLRDGRGRTKPVEEMTDIEKLQAENRLLKAQLRDKEVEMLLLKKLQELERGGR